MVVWKAQTPQGDRAHPFPRGGVQRKHGPGHTQMAVSEIIEPYVKSSWLGAKDQSQIQVDRDPG